MRIVIAESNPRALEQVIDVEEKNGLSCLISFWYCVQKGKVPRSINELIAKVRSKPKDYLFFLDSGVFTARKHGVVIPNSTLIEFVNLNQGVFDWVFNNDEGSHAVQLKNAIELKKNNVPVIPIYHGDMPLDYIDRFFDVQPFIAVSFFKFGGPSNKRAIQGLDRIFEYCYKRNFDKPFVKIHALGTEAFKLLNRYPFYSADSTSAMNNYALGNVNKLSGTKLETINPKKSKGKPFVQFIGNTRAERDKRIEMCLKERAKYNKLITEIWEKRGIKWD